MFHSSICQQSRMFHSSICQQSRMFHYFKSPSGCRLNLI
jgi:hypothetical protein